MIESFAKEAKRYPLLTAEQEKTATQDLLIKSNLRMVLQIAHKYARGDKERLAEYVQTGCQGLCEAAQSFDPEKGRFTTHAHQWIRGRILNFVHETSRMVRVATSGEKRSVFWNLPKVRGSLEAQGIEATPERIAAELDLDPSTVAATVTALGTREVSLATPSRDDDQKCTLGDQIPGDIPDPGVVCESQDYMREIRARVDRFRETLSEKEKVVLDLRIMNPDPLPMREVGEITGGTRQAVDQIEKRVKAKLRRRLSDLYELICK